MLFVVALRVSGHSDPLEQLHMQLLSLHLPKDDEGASSHRPNPIRDQVSQAIPVDSGLYRSSLKALAKTIGAALECPTQFQMTN
jgi:hypothetical protein